MVLEKVPLGHGAGVALPSIQYEPSGHSAPVTPSVGLSVLEPPTQ